MTEQLQELVIWLAEYAGKPLDPSLIDRAERRDLPVATLLSLGHGAALTAVTGKIREILIKERDG